MASGKLTLDRSTGMFKGRYSDLHNKLVLAMEPREDESMNENAPSHNVYASAPGGELTLCGAAWTKTIQNGANRGQEFFTLTIDDPSFVTSLNLAAFPMRDERGAAVPDEYSVVWERPRRPAAV